MEKRFIKGKTAQTYLHDNRNDPYQLKNLAAENPERIQELTGVLSRILGVYDDPWLKTPV